YEYDTMGDVVGRTNLGVEPPDYTYRLILSSFFFSCSPDPPDLHSFPTRRSSDLPPLFLAAMATPWFRSAATPPSPAFPSPSSSRSEEHTSELQSRENLVCRLLLEKKKP